MFKSPVLNHPKHTRDGELRDGKERDLRDGRDDLIRQKLWGAALSLHFEIPELGMRYHTLLKEIKQEGFSHVSLIVHWGQEDIYSSEITPHSKETIPDSKLKKVIQRAHQLGLKVLLFPILWIEKRKMGQWRGTLSPQHLNSWWASYLRFIDHYATLAAEENVEVFSVGSELSSLEYDHVRWNTLIDHVRQKYNGALIYSANWDHFSEVSFWHTVDYIGLTAYYELSTNVDAPLKELISAWQMIRTQLYDWLETHSPNKGVVFTELGYPSQQGGAARPWHYTSSQQIDLEEQRRAYEAFRHVWQFDQKLEGVFFWNWWGLGGIHDTWYTIRGKPAHNEIKAFLKLKIKNITDF